MPRGKMRRATQHHEVAAPKREIGRNALRHHGRAGADERAQERGLASAVRTHNGHALAALHGERNVVKRDDLSVTDGPISDFWHGG